LLDWDTDFWGFRVATVLGHSLTEEKARQIDQWCRQQDITCLYFLASSESFETTRIAESSGFRFVDVRLTFAHTPAWLPPPAIAPANGSLRIRPSRLADIDALQLIARTSYIDTRFYYDQAFPRHLCNALYETWIKRSCEGYADIVLVAEGSGEPVGYISCHIGAERRVGKIGLLGVDQRVRGQGVGQRLVRSSLEWLQGQGMRETIVVTQARNGAAQRLYQRSGFLTRDVQLWYHKWYRPGS
jgi:ribosomal protein S18 acetylase RimI-like enzyme